MSDDEVLADLPDIGVVARVSPEDKIRLVQLLKRAGNIVAMTGDGVNDAPALKAADIGVAMGITGTEVSKEAAVMILTDDNFATIVNAVSYGRTLYDNLVKYLRFQMSTLVAYIAIFLAAGIFGIAGGVPLNPLQILWLNMVVDIPIAIALGFDQPTKGLMARPAAARRGTRAVPRRTGSGSASKGAVMTAGSLVAYQIGDDEDGAVVAATMLLTTLSLFHVVAGLLSRDQLNTIFDRDAVPAAAQLRRYGRLAAGDHRRHHASASSSASSAPAALTWPAVGRSASAIAASLLVVEELIKLVLRTAIPRAPPPPPRLTHRPGLTNETRRRHVVQPPSTGASSRSSTSPRESCASCSSSPPTSRPPSTAATSSLASPARTSR